MIFRLLHAGSRTCASHSKTKPSGRTIVMTLQHPVLTHRAQTLSNHLTNYTACPGPKELPRPCLEARIQQKARSWKYSTVGTKCNMRRAASNRSSASRMESLFSETVTLSRVPDAALNPSKWIQRQSHAAALKKRLWLSSAARAVAAEATAALPSGVAPPAKLAVFVSGGGSNLKALHTATLDSRINGSIVVRTWHLSGCSLRFACVQTGGHITWHSQHFVILNFAAHICLIDNYIPSIIGQMSPC